jgi:dTDP-4-amino-4,6-dideoxygalactose transaminase
VRLPESVERQRLFDRMRGAGIGVNVHYIPVYKQPYYQRLGFAFDECPQAERFYRCVLTLPLFPALTTREQAFVIEHLNRLIAG